MSNRRTLMAAAAIVLALVAGIGVYMYASGADKRAQENASFVDAYVANADIAKGTTGAEVAAGRARQQGEGREGLGAAVGRSPTSNDLDGKVQSAGPITRSSSSPPARSCRRRTASAARSPTRSQSNNLVAVTVTVDADRGVANQIAPGDHVDIATNAADGRRHGGAYTSTSSTTSRCSRSARRRPRSRRRSAAHVDRRLHPAADQLRACSPSR